MLYIRAEDYEYFGISSRNFFMLKIKEGVLDSFYAQLEIREDIDLDFFNSYDIKS